MQDYLHHLATTPGRGGLPRRSSTIKLADWRLRAFLALPEKDGPLVGLNRQIARQRFLDRQRLVTPDTLLGELATVHRWAAWLVSEGVWPSDPFTGLVVTGERSTGKPQLRVDEARKFLGSALAEETAAGDACALTLLTGMRASEVTGLVKHDVDDYGRLLWVADNCVRRIKTRKMRQLETPAVLVPRLLARVEGLGPDDRVWGSVDRHWLSYHVERLCKKAGVPIVSPHGLRGTFATLAVGALKTAGVAATIGNRPEVSATNYIAPGAAQSADSAEVASRLVDSSPASAVPVRELESAPQFPRTFDLSDVLVN